MGSGAGFPGLALAIHHPALEVLLVESRERRVGFLKQVVRAAGLVNVEVFHGRTETLSGPFDGVISRGYRPLIDYLGDADRLLHDRGSAVAMTGAGPLLDVPNDWYLNAPLAVWFVVSIPTTITLADRVIHQINPRPGRVLAFEENIPSPLLRAIPFNARGRRDKLLAAVAPNIFGETLPLDGERVYRPAAWKVEVGDNRVTVRESELRAFLDIWYKFRCKSIATFLSFFFKSLSHGRDFRRLPCL